MGDLRDQLRHEVSSLSTFVHSIQKSCAHLPGAAAYSSSSEKFFEYVLSLARATQEYLMVVDISPDVAPDVFVDARTELTLIRSLWRELHPYIKPAVEADTLHQPFPLIQGLVQRFRSLKDFEESEFALFHTDQFNYFHIYPASIGDVIDKYRGHDFINNAPAFPPHLGLIGIPTSQASSLFLNCLLTHEMGHYAFKRKAIRAILLGEALASYREVHPNEDETKQLRNAGVLVKWAEEVFCDLLATSLIGPCYTFAYLELYDVLALLDNNSKLSDKALNEDFRFYPDYPSHPFRVQQQAIILKETGWWDEIKDIDSRYVRLLEALISLDTATFAKNNPTVEAFLSFLPEVHKYVGSTIGSLDNGIHEFHALNPTISNYLKRGVVPSSLNVIEGGKVHHNLHPKLITLLNSASCFYLERLPDLMLSIRDQSPSNIEKRAEWTRKLESWVSKAIEDVALMGDSDVSTK